MDGELNTLNSGMYVMSDRGFKHIEQYLQKSDIELVWPPSFETGWKMIISDAKLTKQIASLRIHMESLIRRLSEFYMLKSSVCFNFPFPKYLMT